MSYTFLLASGEESSADTFSDIPVCAPSRSTPTAGACSSSDRGTASCHAKTRGKDVPTAVALIGPPTPRGFHGRLNPEWCEWLMGFPTGWTASEPLEMDRYRVWLLEHGAS